MQVSGTRHDDWTLFLGWICMANSILSTVEVDMDLRSILLRLAGVQLHTSPIA